MPRCQPIQQFSILKSTAPYAENIKLMATLNPNNNNNIFGMHSSKSETVGQLLPEGIERQLRAQLRSLRFDQPQDYARLQQIEVNKFLNSKSVHNWLSEWELSRTFGGSGTLDSQFRQWTNSTNCSKADAAVQCVPEEIDAELRANCANFSYVHQQDAQFQFNGGGMSGSPHPRYSWQRNVVLPGGDQQRRWRGPRMSGSFSNNQPWLSYGMDASTNTQTTEETGGTSGMNIYRRASYLEEYAMERVREMEEAKQAKEAKERERELARKRRERANLWRRCFCCGFCGKRGRRSSEDRTSSTSFGDSNSTKKMSSTNTQGTTSLDRNSNLIRQNGNWANQQQQPTILVKKFTLSRSGGMEALRFNATIPGCNYGAITGNYENVTPPPEMAEEIWRGNEYFPRANDKTFYF